MKKITFYLLMAFVIGTASYAQRVPMAAFDFSEGDGGWIVKDMSDQTATGFVYRTTTYWQIPAGSWFTGGAKSQIRHSWVISPVIDLTNASETELLLTGAGLYGTSSANKMELYIQTDANLNLDLTDTTFLTQWGDLHTNLNNDENGALGANFRSSAKTAVETTNPLNMAMYDGTKVRIGIRFFNPEISTANTRNLGITAVNVSAINTETDPPDNSVTAIDSVGNTFARGWFTADEICKMYWAVKPQGGTVADLAEIKANLGSDVFVSSGTFDYNIVGGSTPFEIADLEINTAYTLLYGAEDFLNNASTVASSDFSSDNDLAAPVISSLAIDNITEISAVGHVIADEAGIIMLRVYESGWEPETLEQFENGQGDIVGVNAYKVYDFNSSADTLLQYFEPATTYIAYATVTDLTGNVSDIFKSSTFTTLADSKVPVISSASISGITNHGGELTLVCDEPAAGFGDVIAHWVATTQGTVLTSAQVLTRENGLASGTATLDSATYDNLIALDNLDKNTAYTIHCVAVDESDNVSDVTAINMTTTDVLEEVPLYLQEFNVENLNYHFATVTMPEGGIGWFSDAANSRVGVTNSTVKIRDEFYDTWCVVGPIDLSNILDIAAEWQGEKTYGNYGDKLSLWVTDAYTGDGVIDINNWTQVSVAGDFAKVAGTQSVKQLVPAGFDKAGVYFAFRYYHDVWSHSWAIDWLKIYGSRVGSAPEPVIDWVETSQPGSTSANMMFTANTYGRAYWYLAEEVGGVPPAQPTMDQVKSGALASAYGYVEYTAGNYIDQNFTLNSLKPNTTYHLYTAFRDLEYNWDPLVFYDAGVDVFTTKSLEITSATDSVVFATGTYLKMSALSEGRLYWTVKEQSQAAPIDFDEIYASFDKKGAFNYTVVDESEVAWYVNQLIPETAYTAYMIMTEGSREYYSAIQSVNFTTPALAVTQASHDPAVLMAGETDKYTVTFNAESSCPGWIHLVMTDKGAPEPAIEDILDVSAGFGGQKFSFDDPTDIVLQINDLTQAQGENFTAWLVVTSSEYISPVYQLDSSISSAIGDTKDNESLISFRNTHNGVQVVYGGTEPTKLVVFNIVGQAINTSDVMPGINHVGGLNKGVYVLSVVVNGERITRKIVIQ